MLVLQHMGFDHAEQEILCNISSPALLALLKGLGSVHGGSGLLPCVLTFGEGHLESGHSRAQHPAA